MAQRCARPELVSLEAKANAMQYSDQRRKFLAGSAAAAVALAAGTKGQALEKSSSKKQEFYELRIYRATSAEKQEIVGQYLEKALLPALGRMGIDRVGVFTEMATEKKKPHANAITVLIPYPTLETFGQLNNRLAVDPAYSKMASKYFSLPLKDPPYSRIDSMFMKAFTGMPVIEMPGQTTGKKPRIFELRTYESHNCDAAARKVDMFNQGEIDIMRDVKMAPVFYGETLIGDDVPNLTYMLSADDMQSHKEHWDAFRTHPEWDRMKKIPKYKGTVSKIRNWFLAPTKYSQI